VLVVQVVIVTVVMEKMEPKVEILYLTTKLQLVEVMEQLVMIVVQQVVRVDQVVVVVTMVMGHYWNRWIWNVRTRICWGFSNWRQWRSWSRWWRCRRRRS
jgi:hypothetical protein